MSEKLLRAAALSVVMLAGFVPAQEKIDKAVELRKENAALRERIDRMTKENAALQTNLNDLKRAMAMMDARLVATQAEVRKKVAEAEVLRKAGAAADPKNKAKVPVPVKPVRRVRARAFSVTTLVRPPANPLIKGAYQKALVKLAVARKKLDKIEDPAAAREVVDEMSRLVLDVRRELWELEKKAKNDKKQRDGGNTGDKQTEKKK